MSVHWHYHCLFALSPLIGVSTLPTDRFKQGSFQSTALAVLKQRDVRALDLQADSPQFRQLKSFFKGVSVTLVHWPGLKKIHGLVPNAASAGIQTLLASKLALRITTKSSLQRCALSPLINDIPQKLPPEFSSLMVKFSLKNPQDFLALISAGINNRVMADQRSALDYQNSPFLQDTGWNHCIPQPHLIHQARSPFMGPGLPEFTFLARHYPPTPP
ncbi:hypothetical protein C8R48DRAFT_677144 [Suillus tomentosus]|nr:hypothetical protein C8R48DRAFT_677144 [Suillus tomentosus]